MKLFKIILITNLAFTAFATVCMAQEAVNVDIIFKEIKDDINSGMDSGHPQDFDTFPDTDKGTELISKIKQLPQEDKNSLLELVNKTTYGSGQGIIALLKQHIQNGKSSQVKPASKTTCGDNEYRYKRTYFKILCLAGADANHPIAVLRTTVFSIATRGQDMELTQFLLKNTNADAKNAVFVGIPVLIHTKDYDLAKLLIEHGSLTPFTDNRRLQDDLLDRASSSEYDGRLLGLYKEKLGLS